MKFWNPIITDRSWELLKTLKTEFDFVLIGGWATYLLTRALKSKDIDVIIDFEELSKLKTKFNIKKNDRLKKYETKVEGVDIDIYVQGYSKFVIPTHEITRNVIIIENFKLPRPEALLILKQEAEINRRNSVKGRKDRIDIVSLLLFGNVDFKGYLELVEEYGLRHYKEELKRLVRSSSKEFKEVGGKTPGEVKTLKKYYLEKLG